MVRGPYQRLLLLRVFAFWECLWRGFTTVFSMALWFTLNKIGNTGRLKVGIKRTVLAFQDVVVPAKCMIFKQLKQVNATHKKMNFSNSTFLACEMKVNQSYKGPFSWLSFTPKNRLAYVVSVITIKNPNCALLMLCS